MSLRDRFGSLERRRPTREQPAAKLEERFARVGVEVGPRAGEEARPAAASTPSAEEIRAITTRAPPPRDERLERLLALVLAVWAGHRLLRLAGRILATALVLVLLLLFLGAGVLGRGCATMRGELPPGAVIR